MSPPNIVWPERRNGFVMFVHVCVHVHPETLARYIAEYLTHFHQTYISDALGDIDERFTIWGQKVTVMVERSMLETALSGL